jgi:hypothetical protein
MNIGDRFQVLPDVSLNLRQGPSTSDAIKGVMPPGTFVEIVDPTPRNEWFNVKVILDGAELIGWASSSFLTPLGEQKRINEFDVIPSPPPPPVGLPAWAVGVNIPRFAYFGTEAGHHIAQSVWDEQLKIMSDVGVKAVRFFVRHESAPDYVERVSHVLKLLEDRGIGAVLCLIDVFSESGMILPEDKLFYDMKTSSGDKLHKRYYTERAYSRPSGGYLNYVRDAVSRLSARHSNILLWEIGNELTIHAPNLFASKADGDAFLEFTRRAADAIRLASGGRARVGTGLVNSNHVSPSEGISREEFTRKLYDLVDAISLHYYREDNEESQIEVDIAAARGKPIYVGEMGAEVGSGGRSEYYAEQFRKARFDRRCFLAMPWDMGAPSSPGFGGSRGLAWGHPDIGDVLHQMREAAKF